MEREGRAEMLFWKKRKNQETEHKNEFYVESEDLAVPEVHTADGKHPEEEDERKNEPISYDDVAIPEIHIRKKK